MDSNVISWNGDNGQLINIELNNISSKSSNYALLWTGDNGTIKNINIKESNMTCIFSFKGDDTTVKNINIENNTLNSIIEFYGLNTVFDNVTKNDINYRLHVNFYGDNSLFSNSHLNNTRVGSNVYLNFTNSSLSNVWGATDGDSAIIGVSGEAYFSNCYFSDSDFRLCIATRQYTEWDNITVKNFYVGYDSRPGVIATKTYFILKNSYFENITGYGLLGGGYLVYNTTFNNSQVARFFWHGAGGGSYTGLLLNNVTVMNSNTTARQGIFTSNTNINVHDCKFINNTFKNSNYVSSSYFYMTDTLFENNTINNQDYLFYVTGAKMYIENNKFINNSGFTTSAFYISNTNYYANNSYINNINTAGEVVNYTNNTALNTYNYYDILYVSSNGTGNGSDPNNRCNFTYAISNIAYGGTLSLANGVYNLPSERWTLSYHLVGEGDGVILNNITFQNYLYQNRIENIIFNNTQNYFFIRNVFLKMTNCTFDNITECSLYNNVFFRDDGVAYSFGHEFVNITIKNSKMSFFWNGAECVRVNFEGFTVENSSFNGLIVTKSWRGLDLKDFNITNSNFSSYIMNVNGGQNYRVIDKVSNWNITDCSFPAHSTIRWMKRNDQCKIPSHQ